MSDRTEIYYLVMECQQNKKCVMLLQSDVSTDSCFFLLNPPSLTAGAGSNHLTHCDGRCVTETIKKVMEVVWKIILTDELQQLLKRLTRKFTCISRDGKKVY